MDSTEAWERRKRFVSALSSRKRPNSKCSVSMYGEPYWLASYLAKKMTRRAFSVYRSNTLARFSPRGSLRCVPHAADLQNTMFKSHDPVAPFGQRQVVRRN